VCKPLLTHRNRECRHRNRGLSPSPGPRRASARSARELPICGPGGVRCIGGVSLSQALVGNRRTCRLATDGQLKWTFRPLVARGRTPSGNTHKGQSTDARHRGGPTRSSDEGAVTALEQRGRADQVTHRSTLWGMSR
jgi:hypothetical protein